MLSSRLHRLSVAFAVLVAVGSGCDSSNGPAAATPSTLALPPIGNTSASLKATAAAWAHAFLVGSLEDIEALQGPECADHTGTTVPIHTVRQYLRGERSRMQKYFGRPLDSIKIVRVVVRKVTASNGEALVEYD